MSLPPLIQRILRKMLTILWIVLRIYVLLVIVVWFVQDYLLYAPPVYSEDAAKTMAQNFGLTPYAPPSGVGDGSSWNNVAYVLAQAPPGGNVPARSRGTIIVAHGNAGSALYSVDFAHALEPLGFRVILYEYPGYGSNPGKPGEEANVLPLRRLVRTVAAEYAAMGQTDRKVYLFGQSLGCGVVCSALRDTDLPVSGIILLQPWDRLAGVAGIHYPFLPVRLIVGLKYDSVTSLANFANARAAASPAAPVPVAFVTCADDTTIPPVLSRKVYDAYPGPKLWFQHPNCDHNTWPAEPELEWWKTVSDFMVSAPPAQKK